MIIGLDAKRAISNYTGLGNYSRLIIDILAKNKDNHNLHLFIPKKKSNDKFDALLSHRNVAYTLPEASLYKKLGFLWRSWRITDDIKRKNIQLYHGLSNELPIGIHKSGAQSIVTIHDLIFLRHPEFYPPIDRKIYNLKFRYACKKADHIIAVSERTKLDIMEFYQIPAEKISVIYQGCDAAFRRKISEEEVDRIRIKYNLPDKFILNVGSIEARKNVLLVVKALKHLPAEMKLFIIGKQTAYSNQVMEYVRKNGLEDRVIIGKNISNEDLAVIYKAATIFTYPSFYEGFGIPILEALSTGIPVIAAKGSCLEEAGGPDSIYVDPNNVQEMATSLYHLWNNPELCEKMSLAGEKYAAQFTEQRQASELIEVYRKCLDKKSM